jgi:hypothetical protein
MSKQKISKALEEELQQYSFDPDFVEGMRECLRLGVIIDTGLRNKNGRVILRRDDDLIRQVLPEEKPASSKNWR